MSLLLQHLNSIHPLSDGLVDHLGRILKTQKFSKKAYLLRSGSVCQHIYFIESGLVRSYYLKDGVEVSSWFMKENDVVISVESFFLQKNCHENIQALEDTVVHFISYAELQFIYNHFTEFNFLGRVLTERYYILSEQRITSMRMQRANERYKFMLQNSPELLQRVPSNLIASYLGVTKETLSRIRSRRRLSNVEI